MTRSSFRITNVFPLFENRTNGHVFGVILLDLGQTINIDDGDKIIAVLLDKFLHFSILAKYTSFE